jgi:hypothetical protein
VYNTFFIPKIITLSPCPDTLWDAYINSSTMGVYGFAGFFQVRLTITDDWLENHCIKLALDVVCNFISFYTSSPMETILNRSSV